MQEYWTAQIAAAKWGITAPSVKALISRGRVVGAKLKIIDGRSTWVIPPQEKPTRKGQDENSTRYQDFSGGMTGSKNFQGGT